MASYQARQRRDPLLDQNTQAALERRGKELFGLCLIALGIATALIVGTYSPDDPSWLAATNEPAQNALGRFGAAVASPLYVISGYASWGVSLVFLLWGGRFMAHRGADRALSRAIFAPIAIAALSIFASTHEPGGTWVHSFGLGGLFGDTVLGALLNIVPATAGAALRILSLVTGYCFLVFLLFVLGFDRARTARDRPLPADLARSAAMTSCCSFWARGPRLRPEGPCAAGTEPQSARGEGRPRSAADWALSKAPRWMTISDERYASCVRRRRRSRSPAPQRPAGRAALCARICPKTSRAKGRASCRVSPIRCAARPNRTMWILNLNWSTGAFPSQDGRSRPRAADRFRPGSPMRCAPRASTIAQTAALRTEPPLTATAAAARAALAVRGLKGARAADRHAAPHHAGRSRQRSMTTPSCPIPTRSWTWRTTTILIRTPSPIWPKMTDRNPDRTSCHVAQPRGHACARCDRTAPTASASFESAPRRPSLDEKRAIEEGPGRSPARAAVRRRPRRRLRDAAPVAAGLAFIRRAPHAVGRCAGRKRADAGIGAG